MNKIKIKKKFVALLWYHLHAKNSSFWTGGVTQVVEYLFCNCVALSSNPSPTKKQGKAKLHPLKVYINCCFSLSQNHVVLTIV
jgi:hypothetical protein